MIGQEIVYAPCPCGSGKKFKFCCFKKYRARLDDDMTLAEVTQLVRCEASGIKSGARSFDPEAERLHDEGYDFMVARKLEKARATFRRAREVDPEHNAAWNNEASCAWEMGDYAAACDIQREGNAKMRAVDSFGLARLAVYAHAIGLEDEAVRSLEAARTVPPISVCGALETCFALALYHRHRDIVEYVAKSGMADSARLMFYKGIARANLGDMGQARLDLEKTGTSQHAELAGRYLDIMADDSLPWTADGDDWPYFDLGDRPQDGEIVTAEGKVVGHHAGYWRYTVGQRKGLGVGGGTPYYVISIDPAENRVVVGTKGQAVCRSFRVSEALFLGTGPKDLGTRPLFVKVRSAGEPRGPVTFDGEMCRCPDGIAGVAPGQSAVFYRGEEVIGGG